MNEKLELKIPLIDITLSLAFYFLSVDGYSEESLEIALNNYLDNPNDTGTTLETLHAEIALVFKTFWFQSIGTHAFKNEINPVIHTLKMCGINDALRTDGECGKQAGRAINIYLKLIGQKPIAAIENFLSQG